MEPSASGEVFNSEPQTVEPVKSHVKRRWPVVVFTVLLAILVVVLYFSLTKKSNSQNIDDPQDQSENANNEYKNLNGFKIEYPKSYTLTETDSGAKLTGENEIEFVVKPTETPLSEVVNNSAELLGITEESEGFSTQTINSRTGFVLTYNDKKYYYYPLFGNYYLEIVANNTDKASEILSRLEFTPPQASLGN